MGSRESVRRHPATCECTRPTRRAQSTACVRPTARSARGSWSRASRSWRVSAAAASACGGRPSASRPTSRSACRIAAVSSGTSPNQALFVSGGESFYLSQPVAADYAELIITPDVDLLAELAPGSRSLTLHPLFRRRSRRVDHALQHLRTRFLHHARCREWDPLVAEEWVIALLRSALATPPTRAGRRAG